VPQNGSVEGGEADDTRAFGDLEHGESTDRAGGLGVRRLYTFKVI